VRLSPSVFLSESAQVPFRVPQTSACVSEISELANFHLEHGKIRKVAIRKGFLLIDLIKKKQPHEHVKFVLVSLASNNKKCFEIL